MSRSGYSDECENLELYRGTVARAIDVSHIDYEDAESVGNAVGISRSMAAEIEYENDECGRVNEDPASRWQRIRKWVADNLAGSPNE